MTQHVDLLPGSATPLMRLFGEINNPQRVLGDSFTDVRIAGQLTPPQFIPWLIWQFGLGELTPYVPALNQLIDEGVRWQRVRGTPAAVYQGLNWIGYGGTIEEAAVRRRRWNRFQVQLDRVRDADLPDLSRIDGVVSLSPPARSKFSRGFRGYDVRASETSFKKTSGSIIGDHSGVYLPGIGAKWSFGRLYEREITLQQADLEPMGAWIAPVPTGDLWVDANYLWTSATFAWNQPLAVARRAAIAQAIINLSPLYIRFKDANGEVIGNARAIAQPVKLNGSGQYTVGSSTYAVDADATDALLVAARTGFGDGAGKVAASMCIVAGARTPVGTKLGKRWIEPLGSRLPAMTTPSASMSLRRTGLIGGYEFAASAVSIPFGLTVRERPVFLLRFA